MIIVQLNGGLGNQMFQYALGRRLNIDRKVPIKLDTSCFNSQNSRSFELNKLNIKIATLTKSKATLINSTYFRQLLSINQNHFPYYKRHFVDERPQRGYDENILHVPANCFLSGYWQSEKYFEPIKEQIKNEFLPKKSILDIDLSLADQIQSRNHSVSVHVRRGDYINSSHHYELQVDYYYKAVQIIKNSYPDSYFYFFSDDIEWVKKNIFLSENAKYIDNSSDIVNDLFLMCQCHHHINANSSFSWWGAWLGEKENSTIIVPNHWFVDAPFPDELIPKRWLRI